MAVTFTTLGEQGETRARQWQAKVRQIMPAPEGSTQDESTAAAPTATQAIMYTVLFDVANEDGELMPQMTAQVLFEIDRADQALLIPLVALRPDPDRGPDAFTVPVLERGKASVRRPPLAWELVQGQVLPRPLELLAPWLWRLQSQLRFQRSNRWFPPPVPCFQPA